MKTNTIQRDMTTGALLPKMIAFTVPFILANLLQTLYTIADMAIVGHFGGTDALAAVSISGQVTILLTLIGTSITNGGQVYIAQLLGQGRKEDMNAAVGTFFSFTGLAGVLVAVVGVCLTPIILGWVNTPAEAMSSGVEYLAVCSGGMIFVFGYNAVCAILRGLGDSTSPTVFVAISAGINIVLDLVLVAGLQWGALGAAIATVISQMIAFLVSLAHLYRHREEAGFDFALRSFRMNRRDLGVLTKLGLPMVLMQMAINISMLYVSSYINHFGVAAASVSGIGNKMYSVVNIVSSASMAAMATIVGQNVGAGKPERATKALGISIGINLLFFALVAVVCLVWPRGVFGVFTGEEEVLAMAGRYLRIAIWAYLGFALMQPINGLIAGVGNSRLSMVIGILDGVFARIGLSLALGNSLGIWGYFWGYSLAGFVTVILGGVYFLSGRWKHRALL